MRFSSEVRSLFRKLLNKGPTVTRIAQLFDTSRRTIYRWLKRGKHRGRESFKDKQRRPKEGKVTVEVEVSILALRNTFVWGTARIQQGLYKLPDFMLEAIQCVQGVWLSREAINNMLTKHGINGYPHNYKHWKLKQSRETWRVVADRPEGALHSARAEVLVCCVHRRLQPIFCTDKAIQP